MVGPGGEFSSVDRLLQDFHMYKHRETTVAWARFELTMISVMVGSWVIVPDSFVMTISTAF